MVFSLASEGGSTTDLVLVCKVQSQVILFRQAADAASQELAQVEVECNAVLTELRNSLTSLEDSPELAVITKDREDELRCYVVYSERISSHIEIGR